MFIIILLSCLLFNIEGFTVSTGYWFSETRAANSPSDSFAYKRKDVPTALHCGSFCSSWEECTEYSIRRKSEDSSDGGSIALECIASVGNAGCRGNESDWKVYRKKNTGISTQLVEDDCSIKVRSGVQDEAIKRSSYTVSFKSKPAITFFCELKLHKSSGSKIDGYSFLYVGETKIVNLAAGTLKLDMPRVSSGTWKSECPDQAVTVEIVLGGNAELISGGCRYLLDNYKIGPKVEVEMQTDTETGGWSAKCPLYETGIHVVVGFSYDGNVITHIICSVLKYKE